MLATWMYSKLNEYYAIILCILKENLPKKVRDDLYQIFITNVSVGKTNLDKKIIRTMQLAGDI